MTGIVNVVCHMFPVAPLPDHFHLRTASAILITPYKAMPASCAIWKAVKKSEPSLMLPVMFPVTPLRKPAQAPTPVRARLRTVGDATKLVQPPLSSGFSGGWAQTLSPTEICFQHHSCKARSYNAASTCSEL